MPVTNPDMKRHAKLRRTVVVEGRYARRWHQTQAAVKGEQGVLVISMEELAGRLAGGFLRSIRTDSLKISVREATAAGSLGAMDRIRNLPGFQRAAAASLSKAWRAGLTLDDKGTQGAGSLKVLEREVRSRLPKKPAAGRRTGERRVGERALRTHPVRPYRDPRTHRVIASVEKGTDPGQPGNGRGLGGRRQDDAGLAVRFGYRGDIVTAVGTLYPCGVVRHTPSRNPGSPAVGAKASHGGDSRPRDRDCRGVSSDVGRSHDGPGGGRGPAGPLYPWPIRAGHAGRPACRIARRNPPARVVAESHGPSREAAPPLRRGLPALTEGLAGSPSGGCPATVRRPMGKRV